MTPERMPDEILRPPRFVWRDAQVKKASSAPKRRQSSLERLREEPLRVMVVEDDSLVREALQMLLERRRYEVIALADGDGLLGMLENCRPDMLILDVNLPGRDGFALCAEVRSRSSLESLPVMFLTVNRDDPSFVRSLEADADAYLTKPFRPKELFDTLERLAPRA